MSENPLSVASLTRRAIADANEGDVDDARLLLAEALRDNPDYEPAWLWLGYLARSEGEQRFCFERAVENDPESLAANRLGELQDVEPVVPPEIEDIVDPPPPPEFEHLVSSGSSNRPPRWAWIVAGVLLATAIAGGFIFWTTRDDAPGKPVYVAIVGGNIETSGSGGDEMAKGAQLYFDSFNEDGGVDGRPIEVILYDDQDNPDVAVEVANEIVANEDIVLVIGHRLSSASSAASPIYEAAGMPAITSSSTADSITIDNPWYFRTTFSNSQQGAVLAVYLKEVTGDSFATIIEDTNAYGQTLAEGFRTAFEQDGGELIDEFFIRSSEGNVEDQVDDAVDQLENESRPEGILLALPAGLAMHAIVELRDHNVEGPIFVGDVAGSQRFANQLLELEAAAEQPGKYTESLFIAAAIAPDSLSGEMILLREQFVDVYGFLPSWRSATSYDAAKAGAFALSETDLDAPVTDQRAQVRDSLVALDSPNVALRGLVGPIYFNDDRTTPRSVALVTIDTGNLVSSSVQFREWTASSGIPIDETEEINGFLLARQRVVHTGIAINQVRDFDTATSTYYVDFLIWFKFIGDDDAVDVVMTNAVIDDVTANTNRGLGDPILSLEENGVQYRLFRAAANFKSQFNFHDFPFDSQILPVVIANRYLPAGRVVYAVDAEIENLSQDDLLLSGLDQSESIDAIPNWNTDSVAIFTHTVGTNSSLGLSEAAAASSGIDYSHFTTTIEVSRGLRSFLIKNILPLLLLAVVTYISLFIPHTQTGVRVSFGITGILTGAVLLSGVTNNLPNVDYNVAIEWAFYAFIALSAVTIFVGMLGDRFYDERNLSALRKLDWISRIAYPLAALAVVYWYWSQFA